MTGDAAVDAVLRDLAALAGAGADAGTADPAPDPAPAAAVLERAQRDLAARLAAAG